MNGTGVDFLSKDGKPNPQLSAEYFKKAGYASGWYEGREKILMVGANVGVAAKTAEVVKENMEKMGFQIQMRLVQPQTMYTRYCNTPAAKVAVCPNVGRLRDFPDARRCSRRRSPARTSSTRATRTGPSSTINKAIDAAEIAPADQRPAAWGEIDKQVTATAAAIPWLWDKTPLIQSKNVNGVVAENTSQWDLAWTSLK